MQTIKTAFVVVLLMGVLYGVYVALNTPETEPPPEVADSIEEFDIKPPEIDMDFGEFDAGPSLGGVDEAETNGMTMGTPDLGQSSIPPVGGSNGISSTSPAVSSSGQTELRQPAMPGSNGSSAISGGYQPPSFALGASSSDPAAAAKTAVTPPGAGNAMAPATGGRGDGFVVPTSQPSTSSSSTPAATPSTAMNGSQYNRTEEPARSSDSAADRHLASQGLKVVHNPYVSKQAQPKSQPVTKSGNPHASPPPSNKERAVQAFTRAMKEAASHKANRQPGKALATLTVFYGSPDLPKGDQVALLKELDTLAGQVIYSREHHLEDPYDVGKFETIDQIAKKLDVPPQLLTNINGVRDPNVLTPGSRLKVVRGPFRAEVNLQKSQITLFLNNLYAGRFDFAAGQDPSPRPGKYIIQAKEIDRSYFSPTGKGDMPGGHPSNPYGRHWMGLGEQLSIHGSAQNVNSPNGGCISLSPKDAADLYAILSKGSEVSIRR